MALSIADTGAGIPATVSNTDFAPFFTTEGVGHGIELGREDDGGAGKSAAQSLLNHLAHRVSDADAALGELEQGDKNDDIISTDRDVGLISH